MEKLAEAHAAPEVKEFSEKWKRVCQSSAMSAELTKIDTLYRKALLKHKPFVKTAYPDLLSTASGSLRLWMPGVALIASYLKEKKGLEGLSVCASKKAFTRTLERILCEGKDGKYALIVGGGHSDEDYPMHKVSICVEKKDGVSSVVFMDSFGRTTYSGEIYESVLQLCKRKNAPLYFSRLQREFGGYGCAIFALQDSISFLQEPDFFKKIDHKTSGGVLYIDSLPPAFMIGTQSVGKIVIYMETVKEAVYTETIPGRKKSLQEYTIRNCVLNPYGKEENHYITKKMLKYMHFIASAVKTMKTEEIQKVIGETFVV